MYSVHIKQNVDVVTIKLNVLLQIYYTGCLVKDGTHAGVAQYIAVQSTTFLP